MLLQLAVRVERRGLMRTKKKKTTGQRATAHSRYCRARCLHACVAWCVRGVVLVVNETRILSFHPAHHHPPRRKKDAMPLPPYDAPCLCFAVCFPKLPAAPFLAIFLRLTTLCTSTHNPQAGQRALFWESKDAATDERRCLLRHAFYTVFDTPKDI